LALLEGRKEDLLACARTFWAEFGAL